MKKEKFKVEKESLLLDFLFENIKNKSKNNIKSFLKNKKIKVNGKILTQFDHLIKPGDLVFVDLSFNYELDKDLNVIYEDDYLIAIDKPAGLLSIATDKEPSKTAYHLVSSYYKQQHKNNKIFIVHRLDKDTSGVLLFAKNAKVKNQLQDSWDELVLKRSYVCVVLGKAKDEGTVSSWLKENTANFVYSSNKKDDGKLAITVYKNIKTNNEYSLLDIEIKTGRKNQIRVHMQDLGHPIVGDRKYGINSNPLKRLGLHANVLKFKHPISNKIIEISAKTPKSFNTIVR